MSACLMISSADDPMHPTTVSEMSAFLLSFFIGAMLFSYIIGTISDISTRTNNLHPQQ
jgi:hypothetical protein